MKRIFTLSTIIALLFALPGVGWGQSYLGLDGGLEGSATIDNSTTYTGPQSSKWTKANSTQTISLETGSVRSGSNALKATNGTTGRRIWSPNVSVSSTTSNVTIQFYYRVADITNSQEIQPGIINSTEGLSGTYTSPASANTWTKITYTKASSTWTSIAGLLLHRQIGTGGNVFIDDMAVYSGSVDNTAPSSPTAATATPTSSSIVLSWTAASGGVDNGGYMVVRYSSNPAAADDPNVNGIYATGNSIPGTVTGTVVYVGTNTTYTDNSLSSGQTYYYKIYTCDKAYNYSTEVTTSATTTNTTPPTISGLSGTSGCEGTSLTISGSDLANANVTIGGTTAAVTSNTNTSIVVTIGSGTTGDVVVTTGAGSANGGSFTGYAAPIAPGTPMSNSPQCSSSGVTLTATGIAPSGETWYWQSSANGTIIDAGINDQTTFNVSTSGTYYIRSKNANGCWGPAASVSVIVDHTVASNAGTNQSICQTTSNVTLAANSATPYTGTWAVVSGPNTNSSQFSNVNSATSTFTPAGGVGDYVLSWTIVSGSCGNSSSNITVSVKATPTIANAGTAQTVCISSPITLAANTPTVGTGAWSINSGPNTATTQFSSIASPTATFTPTVVGTYSLRWTISNTPCTASFSNVTVTVKGEPTTANAGIDKTTCINTTVAMTANAAFTGTGAWTIESGPNTATSQLSSVTNATASFTPTLAGTYRLRWTISNTPCVASYDELAVTVNGTPTSANAGSDKNYCTASATNVILAANQITTGTGAWSLTTTSPTGLGGTFANVNDPATTFTPTNNTPGIYTLTWTSSNPGCTSSSDQMILVVNETPTVTATNNGPVCVGSTLSLTGGVDGLLSYAWSGPNNYFLPATTQLYTQNFDGLPSTSGNWVNDVTLPGWYSNITDYQGDDPGNTANSSLGGLRSYGSVGSSNRALGSVNTNSLPSTIYFGVKIKNTTGLSVTSLNLSYIGKQFREMNNSGDIDNLSLSYRVGGTDINSGIWTSFPSSFTYNSTNTVGHSQNISGQITLSSSLPNDEFIWIRWADPNVTSSDDGLGIDDLTVTLISSGTQSPTVSTAATTAMAGTYTITGTATNGCSATTTTTVSIIGVDYAALLTPQTIEKCEGSTALIAAEVFEAITYNPDVFATGTNGTDHSKVEVEYGVSDVNAITITNWTRLAYAATPPTGLPSVTDSDNDAYGVVTSALSAGTYKYQFRYRLTGCSAWQLTEMGTIDVRTPAEAPTGITTTANNNTTCSGSSVTLSATTTNTPAVGTVLKWFTGGCGTTLVGTGASITVSPTATTTYYVRAENVCGTTSCAQITISVNSNPTWQSLHWPGSATMSACGGTLDVYGRVYKQGVTDANPPMGTNPITAELGWSTTNTDPATWTNWQAATFDSRQNDNWQYKSTLSGLPSGTYYYAYRYSVSPCSYLYGGYVFRTGNNADHGGPWSTTNVTGTLTVTGVNTLMTLATSSVTGLVPAACEEDGWTYYKQSSGNNLYFGIKWGNNNAAAKSAATVDITVLTQPIEVKDITVAGNEKARYVMARFYNVNLNGATMNEPVKIRFFFKQDEQDEVRNLAGNFANTYFAGANIKTPEWFKSVGENFSSSMVHIDGIYGTNPAIGLDSLYGAINGVPYVESNVSSFSGGSYAVAVAKVGSALPVGLLSFTGTRKGSLNELSWTTASEKDNRGFEIERSVDGRTFSKIAFVGTKAVNGNSSTLLNYTYSDAEFTGSVQYYRLRQVDVDGRFAYSNVVKISGAKSMISRLYPVPATHTLFVEITSDKAYKASVQITDMAGKVLFSTTPTLAAGLNKLSIPVSKLAAGQYLIKVTDSFNIAESMKFTK